MINKAGQKLCERTTFYFHRQQADLSVFELFSICGCKFVVFSDFQIETKQMQKADKMSTFLSALNEKGQLYDYVKSVNVQSNKAANARLAQKVTQRKQSGVSPVLSSDFNTKEPLCIK